MSKVVVMGSVLAAGLSGVAAVLARRNPSLLVDRTVTPMARFYVDAYLARQLSISVVLLGISPRETSPACDRCCW